MKRHSQQLNIKTTRLASLTAVFRQKRQPPPAAGEVTLSAMDVDEEGFHPGEGSQSGTAPQESTLPRPNGEIDNDTGSGDDNGSDNGNESEGGGSWVDSDSEDEFESDEEGPGGQRAGSRAHQKVLEFELRAAEAGNVHW